MRSDIPKLLEQIIAGKDVSMWGVLLDAVEETGEPRAAWLVVYDQLLAWHYDHEPASEATTASRAEERAMRQMFHGIAKASYPYAVDLRLFYVGRALEANFDTVKNGAAIDGMNAARCGDDWADQLNREQVEVPSPGVFGGGPHCRQRPGLHG